jgi:hypothetical protein
MDGGAECGVRRILLVWNCTFSSVQLQRSALCHDKLHAIQPGLWLRLTPPDQAVNPV